ncbi:MAG TPA: DUF6134 family protein, partial [Stellaceae bacterium]|nr:DUF6134 family protein [Stellaceae bacterium]
MLAAAGALATIGCGAAAQTDGNTTTLTYAVMRNGQPIGTTTMRLSRAGGWTIVGIATNVQVKIAFFTAYRFSQHETERWDHGELVALNSVTDDNGTVHRVTAMRRGDALSVDVDGRVSTVDPSVMPDSLWNAALVKQTLALDTEDGRLTPVRVVDHGEERLVLQGRPMLAHHYSIDTGFAQDV